MKINRTRFLKILWLMQVIMASFTSSTASFTSSTFSALFSQINNEDEVNKLLNISAGLIDTDTINYRISLEKALVVSRETGYYEGIARCASSLGSYHAERFDLLKAEKYFSESFEASKKAGDKIIEANSANNLGTIAEKKGDYGSAVSYYLYAFELFDSLNYAAGLSAASNNLGIIYYLLDESTKALAFFQMSLDLKKQLNDSVSLLFAYQNLGNVYFNLWEYDSSRYYYLQGIDLAESINDFTSAGKAYNSIGVIAMIENNYPQASYFFNKALKFSEIKNDVQNICSVYDNLGILDFNSGNLQSAIAYFDSSLKLSKRYELKEEMKSSYQHLANVYAQKGNYRDAFFNLKSYDYLQNELLKEKGHVAGIEALFIKKKQENRILTLEKEKEKRKTQIILLLAAITIILVVSMLGFYIYRIIQRSKNAREVAELEKERFKAVIEAQEMERKRIAGDLHDSVGQMLSLSKLNLSEIMETSEILTDNQKQMLIRSSNIIDEACQEVRNISHNLMPGPLIRLGLQSAVKELVRKVNNSKKLQVMFSSNLKEVRFEENVEISVYRIIQEIFNNIIKHARASEIEVNLNRYYDEVIELSIKDNGIGFDKRNINKSNGIGWKNIYSRLSIINGSMEINSEKNQGTCIKIKIFL